MSDTSRDREPIPPGHRVVYTPYILKGGVKIYPKNAKVFRIVVKDDSK